MEKKSILKPICAAIGATFAVSLVAAPLANAAENPFDLNELSNGYTVVAEGTCGSEDMEAGAEKGEEGKCGEGKCSEGSCSNYVDPDAEGGDDAGADASDAVDSVIDAAGDAMDAVTE